MPSISGYEPGSTLPEGMENVPIKQQISTPNQLGGVVAGTPTSPDPTAVIAAKARLEAQLAEQSAGARKAKEELDALHAAHPALASVAPAAQPGTATTTEANSVAPAAPEAGGVPAIPPLPTHQTPSATVAPTAAQTPQAQPVTEGGLQASSQKVDVADKAHAEAARAAGETESEALGAEAETRAQQARDLKTQQSLQAMDRQDAESRVTRAIDNAKAKKFTGLFEGSGGVARTILSGFAQILGSLSFDSNHVNQVTKQIDDALRLHFEMQQAQKADLWKEVQTALDSKQALRADQLQEMSDFRAGQAAALDAVITKGKSLSSLSKNKEGVAAVEALNARNGFERDKAIDEATRLAQAAAEKRRVDSSEIAKNYAQAAHARAAAKTEATTAGQLKIDKAMASLFQKDEADATGSSRSPGPVQRREMARSILKEIDAAVAAKDGEAIKAAIASAREQSTRILTGNGPTGQTAHLISELEGLASKAESKISALVGSPTEGKQFVRSIHKLVEGIEKEQTALIESGRTRSAAKFKSTNAYRNPELRAAGEARINAIYGEPEAAKIEIPAGWADTGRTSGGKPVYKDPSGGLHVAQ